MYGMCIIVHSDHAYSLSLKAQFASAFELMDSRLRSCNTLKQGTIMLSEQPQQAPVSQDMLRQIEAG